MPTPVQPDFSNLAAQWSTLTPTGVKSAAYTPSASAPACPTSTAGGWTVDPSSPLPTLGAVGVTPVYPSSATGAASSTSGAAASATSQGAAGRVGPGPFLANNAGLMSTVIALLAVGAGVAFWL